MVVLGVDCGSVTTGFGVIETDGRRHRALEFGAIHAAQAQAFAQRLHTIHCRLTGLMLRYRPRVVAIEDIFYAENVRSALKLGHVRGVVMQAAAALDIEVAEYSPLKVKSTVTGYGRAEKEQVRHMVRLLLNLEDRVSSLDASDALAVAICHVHHSPIELAART
jgi:crossover junction endodeoxyribonuclease RuvC